MLWSESFSNSTQWNSLCLLVTLHWFYWCYKYYVRPEASVLLLSRNLGIKTISSFILIFPELCLSCWWTANYHIASLGWIVLPLWFVLPDEASWCEDTFRSVFCEYKQQKPGIGEYEMLSERNIENHLKSWERFTKLAFAGWCYRQKMCENMDPSSPATIHWLGEMCTITTDLVDLLPINTYDPLTQA